MDDITQIITKPSEYLKSYMITCLLRFQMLMNVTEHKAKDKTE